MLRPKLAIQMRVPKPSYLLSQLTPPKKPDMGLYPLISGLVELFQLGEIQTCYRAPRTNSLNFFVTTPQGKFVLRRHNLSEAAIIYEHQILTYLQQRGFPAPRMGLTRMGQAWASIDDQRYSVYEFVPGYSPTDFVWGPMARREIFVRCGRALGEYHQVVTELCPTAYKWSGYQPDQHKRWREGDWFRQALAEVRTCLQSSTSSNPVNEFAQAHLEALDQMLRLESVVEDRSDLSKLVIHGDYAPWNVLFRPDHSAFILDFNESRLDLKIYDLALATFWFAWRGGYLDRDRAVALHTGYCQTNQLQEIDLKLVGQVFQWIMARSMVERLYHHFSGYRQLTKGTADLEDQYRMCRFAQEQAQQLVVGLQGKA